MRCVFRRPCEYKTLKPNKSLPGKGKTPVTTMTSPLAFRKHQCNNTPFTGTLGCFDDGVCHGDCYPQRTQASLRRCALSLGSQRLRHSPRSSLYRCRDFLNRCPDVGVRHVFSEIAFATR